MDKAWVYLVSQTYLGGLIYKGCGVRVGWKVAEFIFCFANLCIHLDIGYRSLFGKINFCEINRPIENMKLWDCIFDGMNIHYIFFNLKYIMNGKI